jgi:hypothetical protein
MASIAGVRVFQRNAKPMNNAPKILPGCDTCSVTIDGQGEPHHEADCLRQKHNRLKDAVTEALKKLGDAIGESMFDNS